MSKIKPQLPKGMRDFLPVDLLRRQYVIDTVANVFETYGYEPLQTPVLELQETLMGKYGEDAEKLIFNAKHPGGQEELALRYDLTVPLARAFGMHEAEITLPFKRYQIAPVWRAERPQRGRFREFFQCDADVVGIAGMEADAESVSVVVTALQQLGFNDFLVKVNNRKLLTGIGQYAGLSGEALANLYRSIDKLDKIGVDGVKQEMIKNGLETDTVDRIMNLITSARPTDAGGYEAGAAAINTLLDTLANIPAAIEGLQELQQLIGYLEAMQVPGERIDLDFSMVRGLSYYTGPIFETVLASNDPEERVGSVSGGGRYDDLLGLFRRESLPTVGVSLGIERLITLMDKRNLYPPDLNKTVVQVLVTMFGPDTRIESMALASSLRAAGIKTELMMQQGKLGKQFSYADKRGIPVVAVLGPDEIASGQVKFKRLSDQQEFVIPRAEAALAVRRLLD
ncbi:MAG: histidine--tRNA ligase [Anaerolineae bacterium]|nr:histidine--tRNA ligase [Anaerolineae bacterium]